MEIVQIISEHKKIRVGKFTPPGARANTPLQKGMKRVMALVKEGGKITTRHIDIPK